MFFETKYVYIQKRGASFKYFQKQKKCSKEGNFWVCFPKYLFKKGLLLEMFPKIKNICSKDGNFFPMFSQAKDLLKRGELNLNAFSSHRNSKKRVLITAFSKKYIQMRGTSENDFPMRVRERTYLKCFPKKLYWKRGSSYCPELKIFSLRRNSAYVT